VVALGLAVSAAAIAQAQPAAPQAYTLKGVATSSDMTMTVSIARDGARERIDRTIGPHVTTSLYDFAARRVYWIGFAGPGSCSSGRYLSERAPVGEDPVTGTSDQLPQLAEGRSRKAAGSGTVAGMPARIEAFVGRKRPARADEPRPTRAWLSERDGYLLKLEGEESNGKTTTLFEVTQLVFEKPSATLLEPPSPCAETDSEMDDTGVMRAHATANVSAAVAATAELGAGTPESTPSRADERGSRPRPAAPLATIQGVALSAVEQPDEGTCGRKLQLTGTISVDGPATIKYAFRSSAGGVRFPHGESGTMTLDTGGDAMLVTEAVLLRSQKGALRLQAIVQGAQGRSGPLKASVAVPFDVTCAKR
jgi:hypothetical protein